MAKQIKKIEHLVPDAGNANKGSERGTRMIEDSLQQLGAGRSIVTDKNGVVIGGNKTLEAAASMGLPIRTVQTDGSELVVVQRTDLDMASDDGRARRLAYADNRAGQVSLDWDAEQLAADLAAGVDLAEFFEPFELDELMAGTNGEDDDDGKSAPAQTERADELNEKWQVERGQVWQIGEHRLMCGDSTSADDVGSLTAGNTCVLCFTSPPYAEQRKDQYGGIPSAEYVQWWAGVQSCVRGALSSDGSFFVNIKPHVEDGQRSLYVFDMVCAMVREHGWELVDEFCWARVGVPKAVKYRFKNGFEPIYHFAVDCRGFKFNPDEVKHESYCVPVPRGEGAGNTNWASLQGAANVEGTAQGVCDALFGPDTEAGLAYPSNLIKPFSNNKARNHPAAFAEKLVEFFVIAYSDKGDRIYDPFMGSGTSMATAHQLERVGYGMERSEKYCAVILERMADMGVTGVLADG